MKKRWNPLLCAHQFSVKPTISIYILLGVFCCVCLFLGFWWQSRDMLTRACIQQVARF